MSYCRNVFPESFFFQFYICLIAYFQGVTIPSQRRYVHYYERLLKLRPREYEETTLFLQGIKLRSVPKINNLSKLPYTILSLVNTCTAYTQWCSGLLPFTYPNTDLILSRDRILLRYQQICCSKITC